MQQKKFVLWLHRALKSFLYIFVSLLVVCYPLLSSPDYERIQAYRKEKDALYYSVVQPHFTLVFPMSIDSEEAFINEVKKRAAGIKAFKFNLRCATVNKDSFNNYYHTFLVPDEGYSNFVKLHDALYEQNFRPHLRLDIDFVPHIGIGNSTDAMQCKAMADEWNLSNFCISGSAQSLQVLRYENSRVETLYSFDLLSDPHGH